MLEQIQSTLSMIKQEKPLILCLTNYVTMDFMANSLLALGAAPLMSESSEELEALIHISQVLYINLGTLNQAFLERAEQAAKIANRLKKPIILDPVGAGASPLRTTAALNLLPLVQIVRGNASEIMALSGALGATKGVETTDTVENAIQAATALARQHKQIIIISGPKDYLTDGQQSCNLPYGSKLMPLITGMGCTMTAILGAFAAIHPISFQALTQGTAFFGLCGQWAQQQTQTPGSFKIKFIDALYEPDWTWFDQTLSADKQQVECPS
jgi:hydroxyethylthiazole kinase